METGSCGRGFLPEVGEPIGAMNGKQPTRSRRLSVGCFGVLALVCVLAFVVLVCGGWWIGRRYVEYKAAARTLPKELAAAKREGVPLTASDLRPTIPVPESQNGAPLYQQIRGAIDSMPNADQDAVANFLRPGRTAADAANVRRILDGVAPQIAVAERAAAMPYCDFHYRYELGPNLLLPEFASARRLARLFAARAMLQSDQGKPNEVLKSVEVIARIGRQMGQTPAVIAMLVQIAIQSIADRVLQEVVLSHAVDHAELRQAQATEGAFGPAPDLEHGFRGEPVMGMVVVSDVRRNPSSLPTIAPLAEATADSDMFRTAMCDAWEARMLEYWSKVFSVLRTHRGEYLLLYRELKSLCDAEQANEGKPTYELSAILNPVLTQAELKVITAEAQRRLRRVMLQLLEYRLRSGSFPASLQALSPPAPPDPFTDGPLRYRKTPRGFVLYSVGENFRDDGGNGKRPPKGGSPPDIVVTYPFQ